MEFYEEAMSLVCDLTTAKISDNMWGMFKLMYSVFERDGLDYFMDMMPALHNYVTIDTEAFLLSKVSTKVAAYLISDSHKISDSIPRICRN
jgi:hypothetical protein